MSYGRMQEEEKKLRSEIEALLKQADAVDAQEDQTFGAEADGYSLSDELARREARLKKIEDAKAALEAREKQEHPDQPVDPKKQISFADKEARPFTKGGGDGMRYVYNGQIAVDMDSQIIVENHIEDSVHDVAATEQTLKSVEADLGAVPQKLVGDSGYANAHTMDACQARGVEPVCAPPRKAIGSGPEAVGAFRWDAVQNIFTCAHGLVFVFESWNSDGTKALYRCRQSGACDCGIRRWRDGSRSIKVRKIHLDQRRFKAILAKAENQAIYRRRKCTVEPVFGQIKVGIGFDRFLYRGRLNVRSEWHIVCAAQNLKKMAARLERIGCGPSAPSGAGVACLNRSLHGIAHIVETFWRSTSAAAARTVWPATPAQATINCSSS
jgi:hypothetical protein